MFKICLNYDGPEELTEADAKIIERFEDNITRQALATDKTLCRKAIISIGGKCDLPRARNITLATTLLKNILECIKIGESGVNIIITNAKAHEYGYTANATIYVNGTKTFEIRAYISKADCVMICSSCSYSNNTVICT